MKFLTVLITVLVAALAATRSAPAEIPLSLQITPQQGFEPLFLRATVHVQRNYLNTQMCLAWDSEEGEAGLNCRPLEGQYAVQTFTIEIPTLSAGEYEFQARVAQGPTILRTPRIRVNVLSKG